MHFSQMNDKGGTKFSKLAIVAALHVAVGAMFIHTINSRGVKMPKTPEELVVMFTPEAPPPPPPPPEPPKPMPKIGAAASGGARRWKCRCSSRRHRMPSPPWSRPIRRRSRPRRRRPPIPAPSTPSQQYGRDAQRRPGRRQRLRHPAVPGQGGP